MKNTERSFIILYLKFDLINISYYFFHVFSSQTYLFTWSPDFLKDQKHTLLVHISAEVKYTIEHAERLIQT